MGHLSRPSTLPDTPLKQIQFTNVALHHLVVTIMTTVIIQLEYIAHATAILAYVIKKRKPVVVFLALMLPRSTTVVGVGKGVAGKLQGHTVSAQKRTPQERLSGLSSKEKYTFCVWEHRTSYILTFLSMILIILLNL